MFIEHKLPFLWIFKHIFTILRKGYMVNIQKSDFLAKRDEILTSCVWDIAERKEGKKRGVYKNKMRYQQDIAWFYQGRGITFNAFFCKISSASRVKWEISPLVKNSMFAEEAMFSFSLREAGIVGRCSRSFFAIASAGLKRTVSFGKKSVSCVAIKG